MLELAWAMTGARPRLRKDGYGGGRTGARVRLRNDWCGGGRSKSRVMCVRGGRGDLVGADRAALLSIWVFVFFDLVRLKLDFGSISFVEAFDLVWP